MRDWRDLNGDGTVDAYEYIIADEGARIEALENAGFDAVDFDFD